MGSNHSMDISSFDDTVMREYLVQLINDCPEIFEDEVKDDLSDDKVKIIKHYHYIMTEANVDTAAMTMHRKRKLETTKKHLRLSDMSEDSEEYQEYQEIKKKQNDASRLILQGLEKQDSKILGKKNIIKLSSISADNSSLDLSTITKDDDDDEQWV